MCVFPDIVNLSSTDAHMRERHTKDVGLFNALQFDEGVICLESRLYS